MEGTIRLNKYLSDAGVCSRREADRLVRKEGSCGRRDRVMGMQIRPGQKVVCDGKPVGEKEKPVFLIVNKRGESSARLPTRIMQKILWNF